MSFRQRTNPSRTALGLIYGINQDNITAAFVIAGVCLGPSSLSDSLIWLLTVSKTFVSFPTHNGRLPAQKRTALIFQLRQWISSLLIVNINNSSEKKSVQTFLPKIYCKYGERQFVKLQWPWHDTGLMWLRRKCEWPHAHLLAIRQQQQQVKKNMEEKMCHFI